MARLVDLGEVIRELSKQPPKPPEKGSKRRYRASRENATPRRRRTADAAVEKALELLLPLVEQGWIFYSVTFRARRSPEEAVAVLNLSVRSARRSLAFKGGVWFIARHGRSPKDAHVQAVVALPGWRPKADRDRLKATALRITGAKLWLREVYLRIEEGSPEQANYSEHVDDKGRVRWKELALVDRGIALRTTVRYLARRVLELPNRRNPDLWRRRFEF